MTKKPMTIDDAIGEVLEQFETSTIFYGHGTDNPVDEAISLVLYVLEIPYDDEVDLSLPISEAQHEAIKNLTSRRMLEKKPLPYLTYLTYFADHPFYVDERVLVPRSPIAELIRNEFAPWIQSAQVANILDLCTGSGCIAIASALYFPESHVDAIELSDDAIAVANINVKKHDLEKRVHVIKSDLFENVPNKKYDIIVSNPPYVSREEMETLPDEFLQEPNISLEAEDDGLAIVIRILAKAKEYLTDHGILVVEVGNSEEALVKRYPKVPFMWLEFEFGGSGVFLLTKKELDQFF